ERRRIGELPLVVRKRGEPTVRANQPTALDILKIAGRPRQRARARHGVPRFTAVDGAKDAAAERVLAVAHDEAGAAIGEANRIKAGHGIVEQPLPMAAAVARAENDADAAAPVGLFLSADDPTGQFIEKSDAAQRRF